MLTGEVIFFSNGKGYGFIEQDNGEDDLFVHYDSIDSTAMPGYRSLKQGQEVSYTVELGPKGKPQACNVRVVK